MPELYELELPTGFPEFDIPDDNPLTIESITLGKRLFFDPQLSSDGTISCASCHKPERAFTDSNPISIGVDNSIGKRNVPSLANVAFQKALFAEGGVPSLELQALAPLTQDHEMNMNPDGWTEYLQSVPEYVELFHRAYGTEPNTASLVKALSAFQRTIISGNSRYDQYKYQGDVNALNASELSGMELFFSDEVGCANCHSGFLLTNLSYENIGLYETYEDMGRERVTNHATDNGKFKVPSLRNIEVTGPYMHNGSMETLEQVVAHFNSGGMGHPNQSEHVKPLGLSDAEQSDLVNFLKSLTDESFIHNPDFH